MKQENYKKYPRQRVAVMLLIGLLTGFFFNSTLLYHWANQFPDVRFRGIFLYAAEPFHAFCRQVQLTWLPEKIRDTFYAFTGIEREAGWAAADDPVNIKLTIAGSPLPAIPARAPVETATPAAGTPGNTPEPGVVQPTPGRALGTRSPGLMGAYAIPAREKLYAAEPAVCYSKDHPLRVLLLGDSMVADSLSPAFRRIIEGNPAIVYTKKGKYSSGLSRPDYFNWPAEMTGHFQSTTYDLVIVMLGMNDAQDVIIDKKSCYYGSDKWFAIYKTRVSDFIALLLTGSKKVYWIGMPVMRAALYSSRMEQLNRICRDVCTIYPGSSFIPTTSLVTGKDGKYITHLRLDNKLVKVRADDGKHMTQAGAGLVMAEVMKYIDEDFAFAEVEVITPAPATGSETADIRDDSGG